MERMRKLKKQTMPSEDDFVTSYHKELVEFYPHCFVQPLALAEAKRFDEIYALAHHSPARRAKE